MKRQWLVLPAVWLLILGMGMGSLASAQLDPFPGSKSLASGLDPVGLGKGTTTTYVYTINLDAGFDSTKDVEDVVPAEFDVVSVAPSCGTATFAEEKKPGDKLRPDVVFWDLDGCDSGLPQILIVTLTTDQNPGHGKKGIAFFEPTSCGPLVLNEGAVVLDPATGATVTEASNSLSVATCPDETDPECADADGDGWSVACGDCNDTDEAVNPGAAEVCGDLIDNNCDGQIDEGCL